MDILIAAGSLLGALIVTGSSGWPHEGYRRVGTLALVVGVGITIFGEWLNTEVRGSWAYTELMPTLPWIGSGNRTVKVEGDSGVFPGRRSQPSIS